MAPTDNVFCNKERSIPNIAVDDDFPIDFVGEVDDNVSDEGSLPSTTSDSQATTPVIETSWNIGTPSSTTSWSFGAPSPSWSTPPPSTPPTTPTTSLDVNDIERGRPNCCRRLLYVRKRLFEGDSSSEDSSSED